ncbi:hypothetical protein [Flavobacterium lipolyticum]|uniref:Uncharacterized protein n=1 Tax=Flavobacterium lipolyticum TaxID=2893754 RepID=A0ABS8M2C5_9FLAO|nr:hypothetical protein [Flavobacterium sp. F-126]MCC9018985.1 hypothetical protein [Flavobacterium sp. F-126]
MKFPTTAEDFKNELLKSIDLINQIGDLRVRQFIQLLPKVNDEIIIEGVILILENEDRDQTIYTDQKYAGLILKSLQPKTTIDSEIILKRILKNWNKSVEELPFWLKDNYGIETVKNSLSKIEDQSLSELELDKISTIKWWLKISL